MKKLRTETSVILSVHPEYVFQMRLGNKGVEFRKQIWDLRNKITRVYIYETTPVAAIIGYVEIAEIIKDTPESVFKRAGILAGIDYTAYKKYAGTSKTMYGIAFNRSVFFKKPVPLILLKENMKAPQSFYYCSDEMSEKIMKLANTKEPEINGLNYLEIEILDFLTPAGTEGLERKDIH